jgi:nucleoside-diphosphate-sugar epimerase
MEKLGLVGAAGAIGNSISAALQAKGLPYRVIGRSRSKLENSFGTDVNAELVTWNPDDPQSVQTAFKGLETLIYLVGVALDQFQLHPILMQKTIDGATAAGVKRIVLIGTVWPYGLPKTVPITEQHSREPVTFKGKMRKEQEDVLMKAHRDGKIEAAILTLPDFYGPNVEASLLYPLITAAAKGGVANMIGPIDNLHEFIYVPDVGPVVIEAAGNSKIYGHTWNVGGDTPITQRQIADIVFSFAGRKPQIMATNKLILSVVGLFDTKLREWGEMNYLCTNPVLLDDSALRDVLGSIKKTPLKDGLRASYDFYRSR